MSSVGTTFRTKTVDWDEMASTSTSTSTSTLASTTCEATDTGNDSFDDDTADMEGLLMEGGEEVEALLRACDGA